MFTLQIFYDPLNLINHFTAMRCFGVNFRQSALMCEFPRATASQLPSICILTRVSITLCTLCRVCRIAGGSFRASHTKSHTISSATGFMVAAERPFDAGVPIYERGLLLVYDFRCFRFQGCAGETIGAKSATPGLMAGALAII